MNLAAGTPVLKICRTALTEGERLVEVHQMPQDAGSRALECRLRS
ncbi:GntR family transcriptional regulator [Streptomyces sp. MRC013]|nr:GntR family transcriptional regulator [Streptomyces sp. MRC013]URM92685.1 GntR family transcriptional regulator [Streptomyces sp. MRC013]